MARPIFVTNIKDSGLDSDEKKYLDILKSWNLNNDVDETGPTVFTVLWQNFYRTVFDDEFKKAPTVTMRPFESSLLDGILRDSSYKFLDNIETTEKETLADDVTAAFKTAVVQLKSIESEGLLSWARYKGTGVYHLTKLVPFSRLNLPIGGGEHCINAAKQNHGPSWRMIVSLTATIEAYGVYPGGQSGNPGSKFYDNFIDQWVAGKYYSLWMMKAGEEKDTRVKWKMSFNRSAN